MAGQEAGAVGAGQEAQVLRVDLARHRQPGLRGDRPHLGLGQLAEREPQPGQRRRRERGQHVGLILGGIGRDAQERSSLVGDLRGAGVVAGGQPGATETIGQVEHRVQAHVAVAADARIRGLARGEARDERLDHARRGTPRAGRG